MRLVRFIRFFLPWLLFLAAGLLLIRKCNPDFLRKDDRIEITHNTMVTKIEAIGKLELVTYRFKDVVEYKKEIDWLPDPRSILIVAGEATGCLDLRKITKKDIVFEGDSLLTVYLPAPEICNFKVDHQNSKILLLENTYFQDADMVDKAYKYAEKNVQRTALQSGILKQTEINAEKILKPMLAGFSGRKVILRHSTERINPPNNSKQ